MAPDSDGCSHYRRRCQVQAPCCKEFFSCHSCHDEEFSRSAQPSCPVEMKGTSGGGTAGRYLVKRVRCNACLCEQAVGPSCLECGIDFAKHFCAPCKLYADPGAKGIFHCDECGICRVGKREDWFHCLRCEACYSVSTRDTHICVERALKSDCPICMEYLFTSSQNLHVGAHCGHAMHPECFKQYLGSGMYLCPVCQKPLVDIKAADYARGAGEVARALAARLWGWARTPQGAFVGSLSLSFLYLVSMAMTAMSGLLRASWVGVTLLPTGWLGSVVVYCLVGAFNVVALGVGGLAWFWLRHR